MNIDSEFTESLLSLSSELEANGLKLYKIYGSGGLDSPGSVNDIYKIKKGNSYGITLYIKKI